MAGARERMYLRNVFMYYSVHVGGIYVEERVLESFV